MTGEQRLWLIRHAPVVGPRGIIHGPEAPADLEDRGAIARLRARLPASRSEFSSPARRALDTAHALGLAPVQVQGLREQNFGHWTGRRHSDIQAELGDLYFEFWRAPGTNRPPCGESFADQIARITPCLSDLPDENSVLVVHSGTIRAVLAIALDLTPASALSFVIDPLSLTRVDRLSDAWRIVAVNLCC